MNTDSSMLNSSKKRKRTVNNFLTRNPIQQSYVSSGIGKPSFVHALIVIFLEFFAWGLLTDQAITVLNETFPNSTFLANGLIHGVKGILSFLSAPLIGAMSDIWGRKVFLLITVFFTCLPIPLMRINPMWYFAMISISGLFAVTFSVVFAYVADVTDESNRTTAYGLVSATFAASLITSPALGSYLSRFYSENFVIALATAITVFDLFFILVAVPESLPEKLRERSKTITWENVDPFKSLKSIFNDRTITLLCITVFLSYLPEAGQYSCFFVYLKLIVGFSQNEVAYFIAYVGILSCIAQAAILIVLIRYFGSKQSIIIGLSFQVLQLSAYGFAAQPWLIWFSGMLAALSSIGYPAISAYISNHSHVDQQGVSQGMVTGIRGLCNGIGPALYGLIFSIFRVNLDEATSANSSGAGLNPNEPKLTYASTHILPGPPFLFGSILALIAIFVTLLIPSNHKPTPILISSSNTKNNNNTTSSSLLTKYSKESTLVKLGDSSSTYNRSLSMSTSAPIQTASTSMNQSAQFDSNFLSSDLISSSMYNSGNNKILEENQNLLMRDFYEDTTGSGSGSLNNSLNANLPFMHSSGPSNNIPSNFLSSNHSKINYHQNQLLNTIGGIINQSYNTVNSANNTLNSKMYNQIDMTISKQQLINSNDNLSTTVGTGLANLEPIQSNTITSNSGSAVGSFSLTTTASNLLASSLLNSKHKINVD